MSGVLGDTTVINVCKHKDTDDLIRKVYNALKEKGYDPISQLCGYVVSGDPTYITSHKNARSIITHIDRCEILERMTEVYLQSLES